MDLYIGDTVDMDNDVSYSLCIWYCWYFCKHIIGSMNTDRIVICGGIRLVIVVGFGKCMCRLCNICYFYYCLFTNY